MPAGIRILAYKPRRFGTFSNLTRGFCMASWLPCAFRVPYAWLPHGFLVIWVPYQFRVGSSSAPDIFGTVRELSGRFPKHSRSCSQFGSIQDRLRKMKKPCRQAGCPVECVTKFISASKFCSGPKSPRRKFALPLRRRNARKCQGTIKTVTGMFPEYASMLPSSIPRALPSCIPRLV